MRTITLSEFRREPGEVVREVQRHGQSFLLTKSGKPAARLVPTDEDTTIESDGTIRGPMPITLRTIITLLVALISIPASAKWACTPPAAIATGLSRLPLYSTAKFGAEVKMSGNPMWTWTKTASVACTPAQLLSDGFACRAVVGSELIRTVRVKSSTGTLVSDAAPVVDPEQPLTRGTIRHCPMRLPDNTYTQQERDQCKLLDVLNGEVRGPN
jgi:prevent-host-death family protein